MILMTDIADSPDSKRTEDEMKDLKALTDKMSQIIGGFLNEEKPVIEHTTMFVLVVFEVGPPGTVRDVHYASNATIEAMLPPVRGVLGQLEKRKAHPHQLVVPVTKQ